MYQLTWLNELNPDQRESFSVHDHVISLSPLLFVASSYIVQHLSVYVPHVHLHLVLIIPLMLDTIMLFTLAFNSNGSLLIFVVSVSEE
jgi:hypothetical protein